MSHEEIKQRIQEELQILDMHKENLDAFIKLGFKNFASKDIRHEMFLQNESAVEKYNQEFNRLISEISLSGQKISNLNIELKNFFFKNSKP